MKNPQKKTLTLLEVMIVIFIIGIIGSVIGYNMRGSLNEGKAFKTKEAMSKLYEISQLTLIEKGPPSIEPEKIEDNRGFLRNLYHVLKTSEK